jgi:serine protease AprX
MNDDWRRFKGISLLLIGGVLLANLGAAPPVGSLTTAPVDTQVLVDTTNGQVGSFIVLLKDQADLAAIEATTPLPAGSFLSQGSSAENLAQTGETAAWEARGQAVVDGLSQAAGRSQPAVITVLNTAQAVYHPFWIVNAIAVQGDRALVMALAARPDVARIESNHAFRVPLETVTTIQDSLPQSVQGIEPGLTQVHAPDLWAQGLTGQGTVVASADTGVQWDHPALKSHYRGWNAATHSVDHNYNWWDAIHANNGLSTSNTCGYDTLAPCDDNDHGTHTTGTEVGDDGQGHQVGMAPGAKWIACRNMDAGTGRPQFYIDCLQFFIAPTNLTGKNADASKRPDVIDNSYSCPPSELCSPHTLQAAVEAVRAAGIFMSVSAGNEGGKGCGSIGDPPGLEAGVFTVGAVDSSNEIAGFSSRGPVTIDSSNRLKPQLVAPGVSINSSIRGNSYELMSGTSMAAPHVAGAVLLLWSSIPTLRHDVARTESLLEQTALPLASDQACGSDSPTAVPNNVYGYGMLNVEAAYYYFTVMTQRFYLPLLFH